MTPLDGRQIHDLTEALVDAYPSEAELAMMVRYKLNQPLAAIAMGGNLRVVAFNLVTWAERSGRVDELVAGAVKQMPRANGRFQLRRTYFANTTPVHPGWFF